MYSLNIQLTVNDVLKFIPEEEIMQKYLGLDVDTTKLYKSPLRTDKHPTCKFFYGKRLYFKDFSGAFMGDCFDVVMKLYNVNLPQAIDIIASDFGLKSNNCTYTVTLGTSIPKREKEHKKISVKVRSWTDDDLKYWNPFGISLNTLKKFKVYPISYYWINEQMFMANKRVYAYRFNKNEYKIYFPGTEFRFLGNSTSIQGYKQLPRKGQVLIITKSLKDVMTLWECSYTAISFQTEVLVPDPFTIEELKLRFDNIYTFYDFDPTGIRTSHQIRKLYKIEPIYLTNGRFGTINHGAKDASDFVKLHSIEQLKSLLYGRIGN